MQHKASKWIHWGLLGVTMSSACAAVMLNLQNGLLMRELLVSTGQPRPMTTLTVPCPAGSPFGLTCQQGAWSNKTSRPKAEQ